MKIFELILQEKGGAGKSMLAYLQALKAQNKKYSYFVDLDSSTKTSSRQLEFIRSEKRLIEASILDSNKKIDREKIFDVFEQLAELPKAEIIICDFGAPESQQFPKLLVYDFKASDFKDFETELNVKFIFKIVVAGGPSYQASMSYVDDLVEALDAQFEVILMLNDYTFKNYEALKDDVENYVTVKNAVRPYISSIKSFGNIQTDRNSGTVIIDNMKSGKGLENIKAFAARQIMKRELERI